MGKEAAKNYKQQSREQQWPGIIHMPTRCFSAEHGTSCTADTINEMVDIGGWVPPDVSAWLNSMSPATVRLRCGSFN
jgi:hypothetical protein